MKEGFRMVEGTVDDDVLGVASGEGIPRHHAVDQGW